MINREVPGDARAPQRHYCCPTADCTKSVLSVDPPTCPDHNETMVFDRRYEAADE